uniref:Cytochrome P450 n=1 Tax=Acrobeloides nanus TaxID=290746 RepID=A0A914CJ14_9BILA
MLSIIFSLIFVTISTFFLYYLACIQRDGYWKRRGIPTPKGEILFGNLKALLNRNYPAMLQIRDWTKQFGKVYGIREGWRQVLVVSDPDMIYEMLVKKFDNFYGRKLFAIQGNPDKDPRGDVVNTRGARWKRLRNIASPTFNINNLKR